MTSETLRGWALGALCAGILVLALAHPAIANREVLFGGMSLVILPFWVLTGWRARDLRAVVFPPVLVVGLVVYLIAGIASHFLQEVNFNLILFAHCGILRCGSHVRISAGFPRMRDGESGRLPSVPGPPLPVFQDRI